MLNILFDTLQPLIQQWFKSKQKIKLVNHIDPDSRLTQVEIKILLKIEKIIIRMNQIILTNHINIDLHFNKTN